jgi:hypothetical protein
LTDSTVYKCASSLGKAVKRAQNSLPKSPRKPQKVVQKLIVKFVPPPKQNLPHPPASEPHNKLSYDDKKTVQAFYMQSDISWAAPGKKDYVIVKRNGKKEKEQKKFLMSLQEAHTLFFKRPPKCESRTIKICSNSTRYSNAA